MPKWTEYTSKDTLADNDEVMLYDATARANKRGLMSKFWDYVVDKMATAVISKLETNNKTVIGAINALNSDISNIISIKGDNYGFAYQKVGKIVQVHGSISAKSTSITQKLDLCFIGVDLCFSKMKQRDNFVTFKVKYLCK